MHVTGNWEPLSILKKEKTQAVPSQPKKRQSKKEGAGRDSGSLIILVWQDLIPWAPGLRVLKNHRTRKKSCDCFRVIDRTTAAGRVKHIVPRHTARLALGVPSPSSSPSPPLCFLIPILRC